MLDMQTETRISWIRSDEFAIKLDTMNTKMCVKKFEKKHTKAANGKREKKRQFDWNVFGR